MGMWERSVRDWAGPAAGILSLKGFRMGRFNVVGSTTIVKGVVTAVDVDSADVTIRMTCEDVDGITVGPGQIVVRLPRSSEQS